jgi:hypothetical protein
MVYKYRKPVLVPPKDEIISGTSRSRKLMPILTLQAKVLADQETERILRDAMLCATKVFNGLL